jgi:hypothetical protein
VKRFLTQVIAMLVLGLAVFVTLPQASASAADACNPGEIYCMPSAEIQLKGLDQCSDASLGNVFGAISPTQCNSSSDFNDPFFDAQNLPSKQENYIPILSDVFATMTQMMQNDAQMMLTFILVDQMSGANISMNPVLSCANAQGDVKANCQGKSEWFLGQYKLMRTIAVYVMIPLYFVMVIQSLLKGSLYNLLRNSLVMLPLATIGTAVIIVFMQMFLNITDDLCNYIVNRATTGLTVDECRSSTGGTVTSTGCGLKNSLAERSIGSSGLFIALVWLFVLLIATVAIYLELVGRQIGIYMMTLMLPLVMAGLVWPRTVGIAKKLFTYELALIISKVFIVAAFSLGMGAFAHTNSTKCTAFVDNTTGEQDATECAVAGTPNAVGGDTGITEETQATNDDWQAIASGTLIILMAAYSGQKVITLSPAALAGQAPVWNKGAIASRGQVISVINQRYDQYQKWRAKNRKAGTKFDTGPKGLPKEDKNSLTPTKMAPAPPDAHGRGLYQSNNTDPGSVYKSKNAEATAGPDPDDKGDAKPKSKYQERCEKVAEKLENWADGVDKKADSVPSTKLGRGVSNTMGYIGGIASLPGEFKKNWQKASMEEGQRRSKRPNWDRLRVGPDSMQNDMTEQAQEQQAARAAAVNK